VTSERDFQRAVIDLIRWLGLHYFHDNDSRRNRAGFPDLVVAGQGGFIFRELKSETGRLRPEQLDWLSRLTQGGADAAIWRPSDMASGRIKEELTAITKGKS
jgi:hypothetical protein